ncbi:DUF3040 domain-containing protein [Amycolatopsis magusensis]|uniref:DUF3040 domain-containing protein n=1 Tax=Amycolatopsis magusensis TaxID=882444 RepID=UPI003C2C1BC2
MTQPDHHALWQIEQSLSEDDPQLAAKLRAGHATQAKRWRLILALTDLTVVLMLVVGVVGGSAALLLWGLFGLAGVGWIHWTRRVFPPAARGSQRP